MGHFKGVSTAPLVKRASGGLYMPRGAFHYDSSVRLFHMAKSRGRRAVARKAASASPGSPSARGGMGATGESFLVANGLHPGPALSDSCQAQRSN